MRSHRGRWERDDQKLEHVLTYFCLHSSVFCPQSPIPPLFYIFYARMPDFTAWAHYVR